MADLLHSLQAFDLGHLRIVAQLWGLSLSANEPVAASKELTAAILDPVLAGELVDSLPDEARRALAALAGAGGRLPWAAFTRQFGELREAGPGRRDREKIHLHPLSAVETLFYRALVGRAFFDAPKGVQEFAYIPEDLLPLVTWREPDLEKTERSGENGNTKAFGRPATPRERGKSVPAGDRLLDDATTLLAALRLGLQPPETGIPVKVVGDFLSAAGMLRDGVPQPEAVKIFFETPRTQELSSLAQAWQKSDTFNELRQLPGISCKGDWTNQPGTARHFLLDQLKLIPRDKWWSLAAFLHDIKKAAADFQRPAGDYDSWIILREADGQYLRGFAHWDDVEGELIRYLITGPLHWLGRMELGMQEQTGCITSFRVIDTGSWNAGNENLKLQVSSQGKITVPRLCPRAARYQIARFCEWGEEKREEYIYRVTPASLTRAHEQGLLPGQLLQLLAKNSAAEIPPALIKAVKRWEKDGTQARMEVQTILKVSHPELLDELQRSRAGRHLGELLGPVTVVIKPGAQSKVLAALAELGYLADPTSDADRKQGMGTDVTGKK